MPGFASMNGVAIGENGTVDPLQQLFRNSAIGVETGPFISQVRRSAAGLCDTTGFVYAKEETLGWRDTSVYFMPRTGICCR